MEPCLNKTYNNSDVHHSMNGRGGFGYGGPHSLRSAMVDLVKSGSSPTKTTRLTRYEMDIS